VVSIASKVQQKTPSTKAPQREAASFPKVERKRIQKLGSTVAQNQSMSTITIDDDDDDFYSSVDLDAIVAEAKTKTKDGGTISSTKEDPQQRRAQLRDMLFDFWGYTEVIFSV
jgi:hypothetical protein